MEPESVPPDWPFETLKLGEYFSLSRQAARVVREKWADSANAVHALLNVSGRCFDGKLSRSSISAWKTNS